MDSPLPSAMPEVPAVRVSPTRAVPLIAGAPVAALLVGATAAVAALVRVSPKPASSVNVTCTLMALPTSVAARMYVDPVAPEMAASSASHW